MTDGARVIGLGGCLCGAVRYTVRGSLRPVVNCHCETCRRTHGHFGAYTRCQRSDLTLDAEHGLRWYRSSSFARRGFCAECGASLFYERVDDPRISIAAGTLDEPTGLTTIRHIFVAEKSDYYEIADGLEQLPMGMG